MTRLLSRMGFTGMALPLALAGLAIAGGTDHLTRKAHANDDSGGAKRYQVRVVNLNIERHLRCGDTATAAPIVTHRANTGELRHYSAAEGYRGASVTSQPARHPTGTRHAGRSISNRWPTKGALTPRSARRRAAVPILAVAITHVPRALRAGASCSKEVIRASCARDA
jgi:hypothetical protein